MARIAAADGIETMACTPHIMPGVYDNTALEIRNEIGCLQEAIDDAGIPLRLVAGADIHIAKDLVTGFRTGQLLSLNDTRYFLFEPPHRVLPPKLDELALSIIVAGYVPILTHPERLSWIDGRYDVVEQLGRAGVLMQVTAGSLTGRFGRKPRYWAEKMLGEGRVHLLATDAHDVRRRPPLLAEARIRAAKLVGKDLADDLVLKNPLSILRNMLRSQLPVFADPPSGGSGGFWRWARRLGGG
jgi:protein-tyrosine phosphatase